MAAPSQPHRIWPIVATSLLIVTAVAVSLILHADAAKSFYQRYWVDDAAISFTFARHIAEGYGSVAYPGGERVEGFSNPTWVGLLVVAYKLGIEPFSASHYFGLAFGIGALLLLALFAWLPLPDGRRPWAVALALPLVATNAGYAIWNQSGLENSLYGFLIAAAVLLTIRETRRDQALPWSAPVLFLLAITRPEGVGHAALAGFFLLLNELFVHRRPTRRFFIWLVCFGGLFGLYHLWHYIFFAWPFPNTYYAKVRPALAERLLNFRGGGWRYVLDYVSQYRYLPLLIMTLPAFVTRRFWRESLYLALTAMFLMFFPLVSGGDWMKSWRFLSGFPIPLAMLLGLAGWRVGQWTVAIAPRLRLAKGATVLGLSVTAAYILSPIWLAYPGSQGARADFLADREVSAKGIARRVGWWTKVAEKAGQRPHDLLYCDMDMGGSSYNWPGRIMDIGYLLDVPMARHRYTPHWRRMMDEYFFAERRPDLIHIRRGWGQATTVPANPKFAAQYLRLPEDRKFSSLPNGNFVRRDLFERPDPPTADFAPFAFDGGLTLYGAEAPRAMLPGRQATIFLTWKRESTASPAGRPVVALTRPGQALNFVEYEPAMGWLPLAKWPTDRYLRETVVLPAATVAGEYFVYIGFKPETGGVQVFKVPQTVTVGDAEARQAVKGLLDQARDLARRDVTGADEAPRVLRQAERILGAKTVGREVKKIDRLRLATYLAAAKKAADEGSDAAAALLLARGWRIDARDQELNELSWQVAGRLYQLGRSHQLRGEWNDAYLLFNAACQGQPQHAWARRRAEETRMLR